MASNTGHISSLSNSLSGTADTDAEWMQDGTDVIHSGIINALNIANSGSFIASGFDITQSAGTTYTKYAFTSGKYFRDGKLRTKTSTNAIEPTWAQNTANDWYGLICISDGHLGGESDGDIVFRGTTTLGATVAKVASPKSGDIPLAMIQISKSLTSNYASPNRKVQYLGFNKANSEFSAVNAGTETMRINKDGTITKGGETITIPSTTGTLSVATDESIQDLIGAMVSGNTETNITVTYDDDNGKLNFAATDTNTNQLTTFSIGVDTNSNATTIAHGETLTIAGGTNVTTETTADGTVTISASLTDTQLTTEQVQDIVGGMVDDTQTFISVTYDDTNGNLEFVVPIKDEDDMASNSATHLATQQSIKAYVDSEVTNLIDSSPAALNTLNELAAALGDDANFSTTTSTALGNRLRIDVSNQSLTNTQKTNVLTNLGVTATVAEINYIDGVTSGIQSQLGDKLATTAAASTYAPIANPTFTGEIGIGSVNVDETELGILEGATLSTTELNYLDGVTSALQTQINAKAASLSDLGITATAGEINILDDGLTAGDIPSLAASKITSGTFADARITSAATWNAKQAALTFATGLANASNTISLDFNSLTDLGTGTVIGNDFIPVYSASGTAYKKVSAANILGKITSSELAGSGKVWATLPESGADITDATNVATAGALMDGDFSSNGLLKRTGAGAYTVDTSTYLTSVTSGDIVNGAVTIAKMANLSTGTFLGRTDSGTGAVEALSATALKTGLSLNNVENTALSTWAGTSNITDASLAASKITSGTLSVDRGGTGLTAITTLLNTNTTAANVGLGNVTNESKATMFASPTFTGTIAIPNIANIESAIATNTSKVTFPGFGTSGTTALVGTSDLLNVSIGNLTARLPQITESVTIGDANDVDITILGDLIPATIKGVTVPATPAFTDTITTALAWSAITSKPSTFAPIIGSGATDALAGNTAILALGTSGSTALAGNTTVTNWSGASSGLTASTGRASLGATTFGAEVFTLADTDEVRFLRMDADNGVTALSASDFRSAIGAGSSVDNNDYVDAVSFSSGTVTVGRTGSLVDLTVDISGVNTDTVYALTNDLASSEITAIQNIGATTISATQWGYLGAATGAITNTDTNDDVSVANLKTALAGPFASNAVQIGDNTNDIVTMKGISATTLNGQTIGATPVFTDTDTNVSVANLKIALGNAFGSNAVSIGTNATTVTIPGNLTVTGDTTYSNETIQIVEDNKLAFRAGDGNVHEVLLTAANPTDADYTVTIPAATFTIPTQDTTYSVGAGGLTQQNFTTTLKNKLDGIAASATATVDLTADGAGTVHANNYTNTVYALTNDLASGEISQLQNIGNTTISAAQWGYLGAATGAITNTDTVYTHPTTAGNKHIPAGGASGQFLSYNGSSGEAGWSTPSYTTTLAWSAISSKPLFSNTTAGLVPARDNTDPLTTTKFLREDGDWTVPLDTIPTATNVTSSLVAASSISGSDKTSILSNIGAQATGSYLTSIAADSITLDMLVDTTTNNRVLGAGTAGTVAEVQVATDMIANNAVSLAKMATMATDSFLGRTTANTGNVEVLSKSDVLTILNVADGANANVSGDSGNAAIYDNSGTPAFKSGITKAEVLSILNVADGAQVNTTGDSGNAAIYDSSGTPTLKSGITAAEMRTVIGAGTLSTITDSDVPNTLTLTKIESGSLDFTLSGTDGFTFGNNDVDYLNIDISGSSDAAIKPAVDGREIRFQQYDGTEVARIKDNATFDIPASKLSIAGTAVTSTATELNTLASVTAGTASASKAVVLDASKNISGINDLTVAGNLTVNGTTTTIDTTNLQIEDNIILLNKGQTGSAASNAVGIEVDRGSTTNAKFVFDDSDDKWKWTIDGSTYYRLPSLGLSQALGVSEGGTGLTSISTLTNANTTLTDVIGSSTVTTAYLTDSAVTGAKISAFANAFNADATTLDGNITDSATQLTLANGHGFPSSGILEIGSEKIKYSSISTNVVTIVARGHAGTTAATASDGATVKMAKGIRTTLGGSKTTDIPIFAGSTALTTGEPGLVPEVPANKMSTYLRGDGAWAGTGSVADGNTGLVDGNTVYDYIAAQNFGSGSGDMTGVDITASTGLSISQSNTGSGAYTATINIDSTVATLTGSQTLTNKTLTSPSIGTGFTFDGITLTTAQTSAESFADNDTSLMTSAAINDRIESFSYTTNTGDVTLTGTQTLTNKSLTSPTLTGTVTATATINVSGNNKLGISDGGAGSPTLRFVDDTDTGIYRPASGQIGFTSNGTAQVILKDGSLEPVTDNDVDLGTSSLKFKDSFFGLVDAENFKVNGGQGSDGQVLTSTGSGVAWEAASGGIASLAADTSPQLGGDLDVDGNDIVSTSNADINIAPNGTGSLLVNYSTTANSFGTQVASNANNVVPFSSTMKTTTTNAIQTTGQFINAITSGSRTTGFGSQIEFRMGEINYQGYLGGKIGAKMKDTGNANFDMFITPEGTGNVSLGNFTFDADQSVGSGQDNYVLTYDHSNTHISLEAAGGGGASTLNDLTDVIANATNFTDSILISPDGAAPPTGTLNGAIDNVGIGKDVFAALTSGDYNIGVGSNTLNDLTTGGSNTAVGGWGVFEKLTTQSYNVGLGSSAGRYITNGAGNTAIGTNALSANSGGVAASYNTAVGNQAMYAINGVANANVAIGYMALRDGPTEGDDNIAIGQSAGRNLTTASKTIFIGYEAGTANTTGLRNIAIGPSAYDAADTENDNIAIGYDALGGSINGAEKNIAIGNYSLDAALTGDFNTAVGYGTGTVMTSGQRNSLFGYDNGKAITTGISNTMIGYECGIGVTEGNYNVMIGNNAANNVTTGDGKIVIGNDDGMTGATTGRELAIANFDGTGRTKWIHGTSAGAITFNDAFTFPAADGSAYQVLQTDGSGTLTWANNRKADVVAVSSNTTLTLAQTGSYVYWTGGTCTLPANATVGSQYTIFNNTGNPGTVGLGTNNSIVSGGASNAAVADNDSTSYICVASTDWWQVG